MNGFIRGLYVSPAAVVSAPAYAQRLVDDAGINLFVLRAGFNPAASDPALDQAAEVVRRCGAAVWVLIGGWWGAGVDAGADAMQPACDWPGYGPKLAHESQWRMRPPGGPGDDVVTAAVSQVCQRLQPDAICLTHIRFRHPADTAGLFEVAGGEFEQQMNAVGISRERLQEACTRTDAALRSATAAGMERAAQNADLIVFLDRLCGDAIFDRWFAFRCRIIERSMTRFQSAAAIRFGTNAYSPIGSLLCGQDYRGLAGSCNFLQPLLGFVRWHALQPVGAWARFLLERVRDLSEERAIETAASLFHLHGLALPARLADYHDASEGTPELIEAIVHRQLELCETHHAIAPPLMPVLRGSTWPSATVSRLSELVERRGFAGIVYQGTGALAGDAPGEGWN